MIKHSEEERNAQIEYEHQMTKLNVLKSGGTYYFTPYASLGANGTYCPGSLSTITFKDNNRTIYFMLTEDERAVYESYDTKNTLPKARIKLLTTLFDQDLYRIQVLGSQNRWFSIIKDHNEITKQINSNTCYESVPSLILISEDNFIHGRIAVNVPNDTKIEMSFSLDSNWHLTSINLNLTHILGNLIGIGFYSHNTTYSKRVYSNITKLDEKDVYYRCLKYYISMEDSEMATKLRISIDEARIIKSLLFGIYKQLSHPEFNGDEFDTSTIKTSSINITEFISEFTDDIVNDTLKERCLTIIREDYKRNNIVPPKSLRIGPNKPKSN